jgi:hypothetical protein
VAHPAGIHGRPGNVLKLESMLVIDARQDRGTRRVRLKVDLARLYSNGKTGFSP